MNYDIIKSGERIRQIRIKSGVTQEQVAGALNIDRSFYSRVKLAKKDALLSCSYSFQIHFLFHSITLFWEGILVICWRAQIGFK